ncbi:MAG: ComEC/Rec2 family competence protein [bacterium]|nr:ComEC/Rec2 family competence protein [bacterium]
MALKRRPAGWPLLILSIIIYFPLRLSAQDLQVHFIDVGEGDSILIISPGQKAVLIDSGSGKAGDKVGDYLKSQKIKGLNLVIATHPHEDHIGGFQNLIGTFFFALFTEPGFGANTRVYADLLTGLRKNDVKYKIARAGQAYTVDPGIILSILAPEDPLISHSRSDANNNSVIARLNCLDVGFLFMGDAEGEAEKRLMANNPDLRSEVLKVGNHGSKYSTSIPFLDRVKPRVAVISAGPNNDGHLSQSTLDKLIKRGTKIYRTDENGDIVISTDGRKIMVMAEKTPVPAEMKAGED